MAIPSGHGNGLVAGGILMSFVDVPAIANQLQKL
jgi:hypothetical protein